MASYYDILGVTPGAEDIVIEGAYRALMKRYHPDRFDGDVATAEARSKEINAAYQTLKDPAARARYDRSQARHAAEPTETSPLTKPPDRTRSRQSAAGLGARSCRCRLLA